MIRSWNRYWYETETSRGRLAALRFAFFGLLAIDLWLYVITRAYRLGTGGFNVSHVPPLDAFLPLPTPPVYVVAYSLAGFLAAGLAMGVVHRASLVTLTALYSATYFWSQQDGYQHHYLIALVLGIACFIPWNSKPPGPPVRSWAVQLLRAQIAVVYLFGAVAKMDRHWLDGWALSRQVANDGFGEWLVRFGAIAGIEEASAFAIASWTIMLWELFVAAAFVTPRLHRAALLTGPLFHAMVELLGYEIRLFSYYMITFYFVLMTPEKWFALAWTALSKLGQPVASWSARLVPQRGRLLAVSLAVVFCGAAALSQPYPATGTLAALIAAGIVYQEWSARSSPSADAWRRTITYIAAAALMVLLTRPGGAAYEYWRLTGGDLRRRGDLEGAVAAYETAVRVANVAPSRERALADLYVRLERLEDAEKMYERALAADPSDERSRHALDAVKDALARQPAR